MAKLKDTDYLGLSARIHAMEVSLLSRERMERMLEARSDEEAVKVLAECGYGELSRVTPEGVDRLLTDRRERLLHELEGGLPDPRLLEVFKVKYDYHNLKTLLKAETLGEDFDRLLSPAGRLPAAELKERLSGTSQRGGLPEHLDKAVREAREVFHATGDPQRLDFALDRAYFTEMAQLAQDTGSDYLKGYVAILVDAANLRCLVRALRMGKSADFLKGVLFQGGSVGERGILNVASAGGGGLVELYASTPLRHAAEIGAVAVRGGGLTAFEKECDDAVTRYLAGAKYVPFGEAPVIGYLAAVENELTNLRIILSGRMAGLEADVIRERLRESYV